MKKTKKNNKAEKQKRGDCLEKKDIWGKMGERDRLRSEGGGSKMMARDLPRGEAAQRELGKLSYGAVETKSRSNPAPAIVGSHVGSRAKAGEKALRIRGRWFEKRKKSRSRKTEGKSRLSKKEKNKGPKGKIGMRCNFTGAMNQGVLGGGLVIVKQ